MSATYESALLDLWLFVIADVPQILIPRTCLYPRRVAVAIAYVCPHAVIVERINLVIGLCSVGIQKKPDVSRTRVHSRTAKRCVLRSIEPISQHEFLRLFIEKGKIQRSFVGTENNR